MTEQPQGLWLWVSHPKYTQDEHDPLLDRDILEPGYKAEPGDWWSCDEQTRNGDLALLYRTSPLTEVHWLLKTHGTRYRIDDKPGVPPELGKWGTDYEVLDSFHNTITFSEMSTSQPLERWDAVIQNLHGRHGSWPVPMVYWRAMVTRIISLNPHASAIFTQHMDPTPKWLQP
jgi:hypothetical protein